MKKIFVTMMAFVLTIGAQAQVETIDTSKFVVTYDYAVQTKMGQDDREIVDSCCVALMVGTGHTMQMEYYQYVCQCLGDRSVEIEMIRNSIHLYPTIYGNYPDGMMITREFLAPRMYVIEEPMNAQQWTLVDDTLTVMGYACKMATCEYAGRGWTVCYTEEIPSTAGPWKLNGLPGLIVRATDNQGIHTFCLRSLEQKAVAMLSFSDPKDMREKRDKFIKERNKLRCNKRYAKDPTYYLSSKRGMVGISYNDGSSFLFWDEEDSTDAYNFYDPMRSIPRAETVRYYQPLELEEDIMKRLLYIILYVLVAASASAQVKLSLEGHDLLHQLSNTTYEVNAQGRTETWYRVIPNYVMLRVAWQFNRSPKKN